MSTAESKKKYDEAKKLYDNKKYAEAMEAFIKIYKDEPAAAVYIGVMYEYAYGVTVNKKEAVKWYRYGAEKGVAWGQSNLGTMYQNGTGINKDYKEAFKWLSMAADQNNASALNNLGNLYGEGLGVEKNYPKALECFEKADKYGSAYGAWNLGRYYENGYGVEKDYLKAFHWYEKADKAGHKSALDKMNKLAPLIVEERIKEYVDCFSEFNLTNKDKEQLESYFRYKLDANRKVVVRFNFMLEIQDNALGNRFVDLIIEKTNEVERTAKKVLRLGIKKFFEDEIAGTETGTIIVFKATRNAFWNDDSVADRLEVNDSVMKIVYGTPEDLRDVFGNNHRCNYRIFNHHIFIKNVPVSEIISMSHKKIAELGYAESDDFKKKLDEYINVIYPKADLRNDYIRFVDDLIRRLNEEFYKKSRKGYLLDADCVPYYNKPKSYEEAAAKLEEMVGLEMLKKEIKEFESVIRKKKAYQNKGLPVERENLHMLFLGNPGTGKTTVAKYMADILFSLGVIRSNKLVVAERKDLVGQFIGRTAIQTDVVIQKARGGVLFIDEAYSLAKIDNERDFGHEAIETLLTAMVTYKDDLVIIFAGYEKEMAKFINSNSGLVSRIGYKFHFEDYSVDELVEIFKRKMKSMGFRVTDSAFEKIRIIMEKNHLKENFGNGRFVDKVVDKVIKRHSVNNKNEDMIDIIDSADIPVEDF